jgi:hypothetical protein
LVDEHVNHVWHLLKGKGTSKDEVPLIELSDPNYFLFALVFMLVAGLLVFIALPAGLFILPLLAGAVTGEAITTGLLTGTLAGLLALLALFAASPHAMPRAPKPRTVESRITFFIVFLKTPVFLKE